MSSTFLGSASRFAVLGASGVECSNPSSITGEVGVSPGDDVADFNPQSTVSGRARRQRHHRQLRGVGPPACVPRDWVTGKGWFKVPASKVKHTFGLRDGIQKDVFTGRLLSRAGWRARPR